jgi:hypothetical protein
MNTYRLPSHRRTAPKLYMGVTPAFWSGSAVAFAMILGMLYYLLVHRAAA